MSGLDSDHRWGVLSREGELTLAGFLSAQGLRHNLLRLMLTSTLKPAGLLPHHPLSEDR